MSTPDWNRRAELINALAKNHVEDGRAADEWDALKQLADLWERCWRRSGTWTVRGGRDAEMGEADTMSMDSKTVVEILTKRLNSGMALFSERVALAQAISAIGRLLSLAQAAEAYYSNSDSRGMDVALCDRLEDELVEAERIVGPWESGPEA